MLDSDEETSTLLEKEEDVALYEFIGRIGPRGREKEGKITLFDDEFEIDDRGKKVRMSYYNIMSWEHGKILWRMHYKILQSTHTVEFYPLNDPADLSKAIREVVRLIQNRNM